MYRIIPSFKLSLAFLFSLLSFTFAKAEIRHNNDSDPVYVNAGVQTTPFTMSLTPIGETCVGNGEIIVDISGTQIGADFEFLFYRLPDTTTPVRVVNGVMPVGPDFTVLQHIESGLTSGDYRVVVTQTVGVQSNQQVDDVTVLNEIAALSFGYTVSPVCGASEINVNVTAGNPLTYELRDTSNAVVIPAQASSELGPVSPGTYLVVVTDVCGNSSSQGVTTSVIPASYGFRRSNNTTGFEVLQDCNNYLHSEDLFFN